jgi:hypothetical protein
MALLSTLLEILNSTPAGALITSVVVTDSGYNNLDDTAVATSNSFIKIIGSGFSSNSNVFIGNIQVPSANVTYTSSTELRVALPNITIGTDSTVSVFNSTGSGGIYASRVLSSGFPTVTTSSYLNNSQLVSTQLLATGDGTLTYALNSGSSLPAGVTLSANGLISGTATGDSTTTFTVLVSDSQNQTTQQNITLVIFIGDTYFNYTPLLLQADNTSNNATNNSFVDSSNNYNIVTSAGTPIQGSINPFGVGNWSNSFSATSQYLSTSSSVTTTMSGSYTVEAWVYLNVLPTGSQPLNNDNILSAASSGGSWQVWSIASTGYSILTRNGASYVTMPGTIPTVQTWNHIAFVYNATTSIITVYLNGNSVANTSMSGTWDTSATQMFIGGGPQTGSNQQGALNGYISNLRVLNGTALYNSNFTPSTTPLTAIANTVLLTCQSNRFIDNSNNALTITPVGSPTIDRFNPFDVKGTSYEVSANTFAGSTSFSGTGQYLDFDGANLALGTGDFTIEMWIYANSYGQGGADSRLAGSQNNGNAGWQMAIRNSGTINFGSWSTATDSTSLAPVQTWNHIAWTRQSGVEKLYINGALSNTVTRSLNMTTTATSIGRVYSTTNLWNGYVSNFRIVKGTAIYTSAFTPSTTPLTAVANTVFLTCQNSQVITDESTSKYSITKTGTPQQTLKKPFTLTDTSTANTVYSGSYYFNGSSDYLYAPNSVFNIGSSTDFTIEMWIYPRSIGAEHYVIGSYSGGTSTNWIIRLGTDLTPNLYQYPLIDGATSGVFNTALKINAWSHLVVSRTGSTTYGFVNGVLAMTRTGSAYALSSLGNPIYIGTAYSSGTRFTGYISNLRLTTGSNLYTSAFTPPTAPLQPIANTSLLLSGTNAGIYDATLQNNIQTVGDIHVRTNVTKYGTGSMFFDGNGDGLNFPSINLGAGNLTVEWWGYQNSNLTYFNQDNVYAGEIFAGSSTGALGIITYSGSQSAATNIWVYVYGVSTVFQPAISISLNQWNHFALTRSGGSWRMFVNGIQVGTTSTTNGSYNLVDNKTIGWRNLASNFNYFPGYIDDFRITKGYARYTGNFDVPTRSFFGQSRSN